MDRYHTVIVEDNDPDAELLQAAMKRLFPEIIIDAVAPNVNAAINAIKKFKPDFIILDVELNDRLGFEVLDALTNMQFKTLFVSAHNEYMRRAFLASAVDFLEKPCLDEELKEAVKRTLLRVNNQNVQEQLEKILSYVVNPVILNAKLRLVNEQGIHTVPVMEIVYCEAQNNRTAFRLSGGRTIMVSRTLNDFEDVLEPYNFMRIQRSFIINMDHIAIYKKKGGDVIMRGYENNELAIAKDKRDEFDQRYNDLTFGRE